MKKETGEDRVFARLLGSKARAAVVAWLAEHEGQYIYARHVARECGLAPDQAFRQLQMLEEIGLLTSERVGRERFYSVSPSFAGWPDLRALARKVAGLAPALREGLAGLEIVFAAVFGSIAAGTDTPESDVDLLVVGEVDDVELGKRLDVLERRFSRDINPLVMSEWKFRERVRKGDAFVAGILKGPMILLVGDGDELRRSAA
jgi:predicted nucleotidyltransferase